MSVAGISSNLFDYDSQNTQTQMQQIQQEFQQLGEDLQSGNLSSAQSDFATLSQMASSLISASTSTSATSSSTSSAASNPIAKEFAQLGQDLQSGNLSAAQQDFSTIQQSMQNAAAAHGHHHHHGGGSSQNNPISQMFNQLGQDLQSGNLSAAQQDFSSLQQLFQQAGQGSSASSSTGATNTVSVSA